MHKKFNEHKQLDLAAINREVLAQWNAEKTFEQSLAQRKGSPQFVFYEGPPSANGMPGIHHVMARAIKDVFCRYKTQKGFLVERKAGWDTHGLPVELAVEKMLGITKDDIGKKISVDEYNAACRKEVLKYTREWESLTQMMGYWVDMQHPYVTCDNRYIASLWHLLKTIYNRQLLYKGYTIQPYSPAAGTGLSTHELNQPGCYRDVKDTTCVAMFHLPLTPSQGGGERNFEQLKKLLGANSLSLGEDRGEVYFLAWTTTPWTLPSNTALAVGAHIHYVLAATVNPYTKEPVKVLLAKEALGRYGLDTASVLAEYTGKELEGFAYQQLIPWVDPGEGAFRVITGDFVTTDDGTGIVHIAPTFGADDDRVAKAGGIPPLLLVDKDGNPQPMVDKKGKFFSLDELDETFVKEQMNVEQYKEYAGRYVKNAYDPAATNEDQTLDVDLAVMLKQQGRAFKIEKYVHSYPHCWRTDKPVLYYPLDSWFIRTTAVKDRLIALNSTIRWKPESTGSGRFGKWLENLQDWNLSRSRYWGTPLPIWRTEDGTEEICIGSVDELYHETEKAVAAGFMASNPLKEKGYRPGVATAENYDQIDLHRPYMDGYTLVSKSGKPLQREPDLIDVWLDSGAMPFAQEFVGVGEKKTPQNFPADFIAEGVDQTRGWFFTLHAVAAMVEDSVAFKNVISNGLVLDKNGNKMSKRLGNAVDPFKVMEEYGADALRWYMLTNAQPWDNLKFDSTGVDEVRRKFFGTLYNTYSFFALYANVDGYTGSEKEVPVAERPEIDRWILSLLHTLIKEVDAACHDYDCTTAGRKIEDFVCDQLSNWYVRLNRKRFWGGDMTRDKLAAYQTLHECLTKVVLLAAPIAPFITDRIFRDINAVSGKFKVGSVHLADFPKVEPALINKELENEMSLAQEISSQILALRRKANIKVRQPLSTAQIPYIDEAVRDRIVRMRELIQAETNVENIKTYSGNSVVINKSAKPNFKLLGKKCGANMKEVAQIITEAWTRQDVADLEITGKKEVLLSSGNAVEILLSEVVISTEGNANNWLTSSNNGITVELDTKIDDDLRKKGIARELINRIQNLRKESGFNVTDKITIQLENHPGVAATIDGFKELIASQTLAASIDLVAQLHNGVAVALDDFSVKMKVERMRNKNRE